MLIVSAEVQLSHTLLRPHRSAHDVNQPSTVAGTDECGERRGRLDRHNAGPELVELFRVMSVIRADVEDEVATINVRSEPISESTSLGEPRAVEHLLITSPCERIQPSFSHGPFQHRD